MRRPGETEKIKRKEIQRDWQGADIDDFEQRKEEWREKFGKPQKKVNLNVDKPEDIEGAEIMSKVLLDVLREKREEGLIDSDTEINIRFVDSDGSRD